MANILIPLFVLPLYAAMIRIDRCYMQAAASLGASSPVIFWKVFFPISAPAFLSTVLLIVTLALFAGHRRANARLGG